MKDRFIIGFICESTYGGLHGINDIYYNEDDDSDESYYSFQEDCIDIGHGLIESYSNVVDEETSEPEYYIWRQKDDSTLTESDIIDMVQIHGFYLMEDKIFNKNFYAWER